MTISACWTKQPKNDAIRIDMPGAGFVADELGDPGAVTHRILDRRFIPLPVIGGNVGDAPVNQVLRRMIRSASRFALPPDNHRGGLAIGSGGGPEIEHVGLVIGEGYARGRGFDLGKTGRGNCHTAGQNDHYNQWVHTIKTPSCLIRWLAGPSRSAIRLQTWVTRSCLPPGLPLHQAKMGRFERSAVGGLAPIHYMRASACGSSCPCGRGTPAPAE